MTFFQYFGPRCYGMWNNRTIERKNNKSGCDKISRLKMLCLTFPLVEMFVLLYFVIRVKVSQKIIVVAMVTKNFQFPW